MINKKSFTSLLVIVFSFISLSGCNSQHKENNTLGLVQTEMIVKRATHTATLLQDGRVLIAGGMQDDGRGNENSIKEAEIYDPVAGTFTKTGSMIEPHSAHNAVLLPNGKVLIAGGWGNRERSTTIELYDPETGTFSVGGQLSQPRAGMSAILLSTGKVLFCGGSNGRDSYLNTAELFDPETNTLTPAGDLHSGKYSITTTLLKNGKVLITGGGTASEILTEAEIYDPETNTFTLAASMNVPRYKHAAVMLEDGNVLIVGGSNEKDWRGKYASAELYDVNADEFKKVSDMSGERFKMTDAVALLNDGKVLIGGGNKVLEMYDPSLKTFSNVSELADPLYYSTATLLNNGSVLIAGGYNNNITATGNAWVFKL